MFVCPFHPIFMPDFLMPIGFKKLQIPRIRIRQQNTVHHFKTMLLGFSLHVLRFYCHFRSCTLFHVDQSSSTSGWLCHHQLFPFGKGATGPSLASSITKKTSLFFGEICCCGTLATPSLSPKKVEKYQGHQRSVGWYVGEGFVAHLSYLKISQGYYSNAKRRCTTAVAEGTGSLILFASGKNWSGSTWFHKKWGSCWYWHWAFFTWGYSKHGIFPKKQGRNSFGVALDDFQKRVSTIADMKKPPQAYHI